MAKVTENLDLSDFGISPSLSNRLRVLGESKLKPIQPDEFTVADLVAESGITEEQARAVIRAGLASGELVKIERLRYREGQKPIAGNNLAYKFVETDNAKAQPDKKKSVRQADSRAR